jgi:hypothetical protein
MAGGADQIAACAHGKSFGHGAHHFLHDGMMGNFRLGVATKAQFDGPFLQPRKNLRGIGFPFRRDLSVAFIAGNGVMGVPPAWRGR